MAPEGQNKREFTLPTQILFCVFICLFGFVSAINPLGVAGLPLAILSAAMSVLLALSFRDDAGRLGILLAVNLTSGSGSYRFRVSSVTKTDGCFTVGISRADTGTQIVTCDMAYWLVMCEVERTELSGITEFDAVYKGVN